MLHVARGVWSTQTLPEYRRMLGEPLDEREASIRVSHAALPDVEIESKLHAARRITLAPIVALGVENGIDEGRWDVRDLVPGYPKPLLVALADASHSLQRDAFDRFMPVLETFLAQ